jgi:hypothetical protein
LLTLAALVPAGTFAQTPEESWLGALSIETGVVSARSSHSAALFAAGAELRRPHIAGSFLRVELGGWRADVLELGARVARWDQTLGVGVMHAFGQHTGPGALTPSLGLGLALHAIGREDASDAVASVRFRRTLHPAAFMDAAVALHLTRSELLSLELRARYATIANVPDQFSIRLGMRVHPGTGASGVVRGEAASPSQHDLSKTGVVEPAPAHFNADESAESNGHAGHANAVELNLAFGAFAAPTQLTKEKSAEVKAVTREFMRADENAAADVVAYTSSADLQDGSATLRAAAVARVLAGAGVRTDRLHVSVRVAGVNAPENGSVRIRLTR